MRTGKRAPHGCTIGSLPTALDGKQVISRSLESYGGWFSEPPRKGAVREWLARLPLCLGLDENSRGKGCLVIFLVSLRTMVQEKCGKSADNSK